MESLTKTSVGNHLKKFMAYASRPLTEFHNYEALEMVEALQHCSHDNKDDKEAYYRLIYKTARGKVDLPTEHFRGLLLRLLGDKVHEKVFETVAKVEKTYRQRNRAERPGATGATSRAWRPLQSSPPRCFYCSQTGHFKAQCHKLKRDTKGNDRNGNLTGKIE
ncbi:MAG: hypothetical protein DSY43_04135 [Gammaproteobacteria bacterium]|nr:MAG: hypothetical protein DSY43_04135 [Gammaproteobacteria bacterium]